MFRVFFPCLLAMSALLVGVGSSHVLAQDQRNVPIVERRVDLEIEQMEIGKAVAYLFAKVNGQYRIATDVRGITTVSLRNVRFEDALANVLRQVNATWRVRDSVYEIVLKPQPEIDWNRVAEEERQSEREDVREVLARLFKNVVVSVTVSPYVTGRVKISEAELKDITFEAAIHRILKQVNATYRVEGGVYEIVPQDAGQKLVTFAAENEDARDAIRMLFRSVDVLYSIAPEIAGPVSVNFKNVPLNTALTTMLRQVNATYQVEGGVYQIVLQRRVINFSGPDPTDYSKTFQVKPAGPPTMTQDARYLYILKDDQLYKVSKADLKTVEMRKLGE